ncbi:MAG: 3-phenylpropionate dioxygenase [Alphaproteobacteria bacterium]|nr:MAG: 3-phenylpropionate dioxygenase [Alphaproteobacteria bacterium]
MGEELVTADQLEERMDLGLLNYWYPVLPSWSVSETPIGITRLGQKIALWRDKDGVIHAIEDRCPHRGARLSLGWNVGDRLACWYHGVQVDGKGNVVEVPAEKNCPMVGEACVTGYSVKEVRGAVFLYFGDELNQEPVDIGLPEELTDDEEYGSFLCMAKWKVNHRYAVENVMDPMHGAYLHGESHSMAAGDKSAEMHITKTELGLIFEKVGQKGVNFDWTELRETGVQALRLAIPYGPEAGPGGAFTIVGMCTPVDREHCLVFFWRVRQISGWKRDLWRFMYRNSLEKKHWDVLEQDRLLLENLVEDARDQEFLYTHDMGLVRWRRLLQKKAKAQLQAVAEAKA